jgi:hypothetical protein
MKRSIGRRQFLTAMGVIAGSAVMAPSYGSVALPQIAPDPGYEPLTRLDDGWRLNLASSYLDDSPSIYAQSLQDGLAIWDRTLGGYMVVHSSSRTVLESSLTAPNPYRGVTGRASFLGPGQYYAGGLDRGVNLFTGDTFNPRDLQVIASDAVDQIQEILVPTELPQSASLMKSGGGLPPVKASEVKSRVDNYTYITGSTLYKNTEGTCGWVAGSIITRYWHARSSKRALLPTKFRSGTNMTASPNFATHLQNGKGNGTWARTVKDQLIWNANHQSVAHSAAWALGNIGMWNELNKGNPFILFGSIPVNESKKKGGHAVVAYGQTTGGDLITHYGWSGYTNIVLNAGLVGSNTKFRLS